MVRLLLIVLFSSWSFAGLQYLTKSLPAETSFETAPSAWSSPPDDGYKNVSIGFNFPFNGTTYSTLSINTNGMISFSSNDRAYSNKRLPYSSATQSIFPYWDDLNPRNGGSIHYGTVGSGANVHFIVHWKSIPHYGNTGRYNFQLVLYPNGNVRFRYDATSSTTGASATVGVQENTSNYDQHVYNTTSGFDASKDILYSTATANLSLIKSSCVISDPINGTTEPKRITGATIRYTLEVQNSGAANADNVILTDTVDTTFDSSTIQNLQINAGDCDCLGVDSASNNGINGSANGENPVKLDFGTVAGTPDPATPVVECGYFEVDVK